MTELLHIFPFLGLITFKNPIKFKVLIVLDILAIWILFVLRLNIDTAWFASQNYKMSLFFSMFLFFLMSVTSTVTLVESFRTVNKQKMLLQKLAVIDLYLNSSRKHYNAPILKTTLLIFFGTTCISCTIAHLIMVNVLHYKGIYYYIFLSNLLAALRLFQMTIWLDQFLARIIRLKKELQRL